jgi:hypothetical protein
MVSDSKALARNIMQYIFHIICKRKGEKGKKEEEEQLTFCHRM